EICATRRAARLGVIVGEQHAFRRQAVEVRRLPRHDSAMIGADVEPADVVAHDDENVGRPLLLLRRHGCKHRGSEQCCEAAPAAPPVLQSTLLLYVTMCGADAAWASAFSNRGLRLAASRCDRPSSCS